MSRAIKLKTWLAAPLAVALSCFAAASVQAQTAKLTDQARTQLGLDASFNVDSDKGANELASGYQAFIGQKFDDALSQFKSAHNANAGVIPPARVLLARLLAAANRLDLARMQLELAAAERDEKSGEPIEHPEVYLTLGRLALAEGRLTDAWLEFTKALDLAVNKGNSDGSPPPATLLREIYAGFTTVYEQRGDWKLAKSAAEKWVANAGADDLPQAELRFGRAFFFLDPKAPDEKTAEEHFKTAYDAEKGKKGIEESARVIDHPKVSLAALCAQKAGNDPKSKDYTTWFEKAKTYLDDAVKDAANETPVQQAKIHAAYSNLYRSANDMDAAQREADAAAKLDPTSDALKQLKAVIAMNQKDFKAAEEGFRDLYQKSPSNFFASNGLALALVGGGKKAQLREATELAEMNARAFGQKSAEAWATLGWVYFNDDRINEAAQVLQQAVQGAQGQASPDTAYYLAQVMAATGKLNEAVQLLQGAVGSQGNFNYREEAKEWLKTLLNRPGVRAPADNTSSSNGGTPARPAATTPKPSTTPTNPKQP